VAVAVAVAVGVNVAVAVGVGVRVAVAVAVAVGVGVNVAVAVGVAVGVRVAVGLAVAVAVGVGVGPTQMPSVSALATVVEPLYPPAAMSRLLPIALPDVNERTLFMFGEAVQELLAGLKNLPALVVSGTCGRLNSDHGKDSLLGASATVSPALLGPAPTKGLPPPNTHSKPLAAPLPGTLFWNPVSGAFAV